MSRTIVAAALIAAAWIDAASASPRPAFRAAIQLGDASTFADSATKQLVARASRRHRDQEKRLGGYTARVHTMAEGRAAWTRFGDGLKLFVYEMTAALHWQRPNHLRIDVLGARSRSPRIPGMRSRDQMVGFWTEALASEPWFAPRALGEEIEMLGILGERFGLHLAFERQRNVERQTGWASAPACRCLVVGFGSTYQRA